MYCYCLIIDKKNEQILGHVGSDEDNSENESDAILKPKGK